MSDFVPGNMNLEQYEAKLRRMAQVLETIQDGAERLEPGQLEVAIERNRLISKMHEESGGDLALQNRMLSRELAGELLMIDNTEEQVHVMEAMEGLLIDGGVWLLNLGLQDDRNDHTINGDRLAEDDTE